MREGATPPGQRVGSDSGLRFLRLLGLLWATALVVIVGGALLAPHLGRLADLVLHQTVYRDWTPLRLQTTQPFFSLALPQHAVKSYYSALYRLDAAQMERLTHDPFRHQMRQRLAAASPIQNPIAYRSYLRIESQAGDNATVMEKFHLFWRRGLRFHLQRLASTWQIVGVELVRCDPC